MIETNKEEQAKLWDAATQETEFESKFFKFEKETTELVLTEARMEQKPEDLKNNKGEPHFNAGKNVFVAKVIEIDGEKVDKVLEQSGKNFLKKIRPLMENKEPKDITKLRIVRLGENFDIQWAIQEISNGGVVEHEEINDDPNKSIVE